MIYFGNKEYTIENNYLLESEPHVWIKKINWEDNETADKILKMLDTSNNSQDSGENTAEESANIMLDISSAQEFANMVKEHFNTALKLDSVSITDENDHDHISKNGEEILNKCAEVIVKYNDIFHQDYDKFNDENDKFHIVEEIQGIDKDKSDNEIIMLDKISKNDLLSSDEKIADAKKWINGLKKFYNIAYQHFKEVVPDNILDNDFAQMIDTLLPACIIKNSEIKNKEQQSQSQVDPKKIEAAIDNANKMNTTLDNAFANIELNYL